MYTYVSPCTGIVGCGVRNASVPGIITSPNYPENYGGFVDCRYALLASPGHVIVLTFDAFEMEQLCPRCGCDSVTVRVDVRLRVFFFAEFSSVNH